MSRILIVDDDVTNADLLTSIFENEKFEVESIHNCDMLQATIQNFQPHLILMDIQLNCADGRILCNVIKKHPKNTKIPVILLSVLTPSQFLEVTCSADEFVTKPFEVENLLQIVKSHLIDVV
ncbi:response regulator [Pedobacter aquatilis]|uniref:response regulator n=1 Tax=Pedobacter aquatilis TaxID=351343 RepID=UPI0025B370B7|nr:response regulator [Pedobacter aquatilis]MDN3588579.1 response regulator [Pedobacter aquatilis]